eukprot:1895708-Rhodomonas_salina.1
MEDSRVNDNDDDEQEDRAGGKEEKLLTEVDRLLGGCVLVLPSCERESMNLHCLNWSRQDKPIG